MRLHVVSDVHGAVEALGRAGDGADALICLGDLILFVDYADHSRGIFGDLFGESAVDRFIELRTAGRFKEAREFTSELWAALEAGTVGRAGADGTSPGPTREVAITAAVRKQYSNLFTVMPTPAYLTYGNVDVPTLWREYLRDGMRLVDGSAVDIGGLGFAFVGGGLVTKLRTPYEIDEEAYAAKVKAACEAALECSGRVDVLCTHIPPALPELTYDVVARRFERGSAHLLEAIRQHQPRYALFGHVHQPLLARTRIGHTECINVGHFARTGTPYVLHM